jgi:hypothetical protein
MGYGTKTRFGVANNLPEPGSYTARSDFEENLVKRRGSKFGDADRKYILADEDNARRSPSPSYYHNTGQLKYPSLSYSLGPRTKKGRTEFINVLKQCEIGSRTRPIRTNWCSARNRSLPPFQILGFRLPKIHSILSIP